MSRKIKHRSQGNKSPHPRYLAPRIELWVALFGLIYYVAQGGLASLDPTNIVWLRKTNDWTQHYFGWAFGRQAPWSFPFGAIPELGRPVGATIALMDANPLVSLLLKPFSAILPAHFQFIGPWMGLCLALQGFFGVKLTRAVLPTKACSDAWLSALGGALFVVAPIVLHRLDHDTLMAHFLIVGSLWLCLSAPERADTPSWPIRRRYILALSVIAAGTHPYLLAMVAPFLGLALFVGVQRTAHSRQGAMWQAPSAIVAWLLALCIELWALGYVSPADSIGSYGFGFFTADITALINPIGWSRLLPTLPYHRGQFYEGFGFMGLGALALLALAGGITLWRPRLLRPKLTPVLLGAVASVMAIFALSNNIHLLGKTLIYLPRLYQWMDPIPAALRSSGRFVWPLHYLLVAFALATVTRFFSVRWSRCLVGLAVLATLVDLKPEKVRERLTVASFEALSAPIWEEAAPGTKHVIMLPPLFSASSAGECAPWPSPAKFEVPPTFYAAAHNMSINSVYASRARSKTSHAYCKRILAEAARGEFQDDAMYLVDPRLIASIITPHKDLTCWQADGRIGCVHQGHRQRERLQAIVRGLIKLP